jgi:putative peptidoglycan lipid II flippase
MHATKSSPLPAPSQTGNLTLVQSAGSLTRQGLVSATGLLIAANAASKLMGFTREILTARAYGVSAQVDAFLVALSVPDLVGSALGAAMAAALIPRLTELSTAPGQAHQYARRTLSVSLYLSVVLLSLTFFGAHWIIKMFAPGMSPSVMPLAVNITRVLSLVTAGLFLDRVLTGIFQGFHHFLWPAASVLLFNACSILFLIVFAPTRGIWALVNGWTLGVVLAMAVQGILLVRYLGAPIFSGLPVSDLRWLGLSGMEIFFLTSVPSLLYVIARAIAATLQEGSVATLGYAQRLFQLPVEVVIMGVLLGTYPMLSKISCQGNKKHLASSVDELSRTLLLVSTLIATLMMVLSHDLVKLVFQRGAFDIHATMATSAVLFCIAPALPGLATAMFAMRVFMSCGKTREVIFPVLMALVLDGILSWLAAPRFGTPGIAIAFSVTWNILAIQMVFALRKQTTEFQPLSFLFSTARIYLTGALTCTLVMAVYNKTGISHLVLAGTLTTVLFLGVVLIFERGQRGLLQKLFRRFGQITRQAAPQLEISSS